ncbi:MAG: hypothetical protein ACTSQJ_16565, partial [Promethearchaeota archaeon]
MRKKRDLSEVLSQKELKRIRENEKLQQIINYRKERFEKLIVSTAERLTKERQKKDKYRIFEEPEIVIKNDLDEFKKYPLPKRLDLVTEKAKRLLENKKYEKAIKYYAEAALLSKKLRNKPKMKKYSSIVKDLLEKLK